MKKNNAGFVMVFVLMISSLLLIFAMSLIGLTMSEYHIANAYSGMSRSQYLAESGLYQIRFAADYNAEEISNAITEAIKGIDEDSYGTDKLWVQARIKAVNKTFDDVVDCMKSTAGFGERNNVYKDGYFIVKKIDIKEEVSDINTYHDVIYPLWVDKDALDGSDKNNYYGFVISLETEGSYRNILMRGRAELECDFDKTKDEVIKIKSWTIK